MADIIYNSFLYNLTRRKIDWNTVQTGTSSMWVALVDDTYTPNKDDDTWESGSDPYDSELSTGNGYTAGGDNVYGLAIQQDGSDLIDYKITVPTWTASGGSIGAARYGVLYLASIVSPQTNVLIYCFDFSSNQTAADSAIFRININGQTSGSQILMQLQQQ